MADEHRHSHAGRRNRQVGQLHDLPRLRHELRFLVRLVADPVPVHQQVVLGSCLGLKFGHTMRARAGDRLIRRDPDALDADRVVQWLEHAGQRNRAAVRVRNDAVARERFEGACAIHLGHDERIAVDEPIRGRLVDADRASGRGVRHERATRGGPDREEAEVEVAGGEQLRRCLLDLELVAAVADAAAG